MPNHANALAETKVIQAIRNLFPKEAERIDEFVASSKGDKTTTYIWLEHFSQFTTDAIKRGDFENAEKHLKLLSNLILNADETTNRFIDVAYVESLMRDIKDKKLKRQGWKLIPENLKALYIAMWGKQDFMK